MQRLIIVFIILGFTLSCESNTGFKIPDVSKPYEKVIRSNEKNPSNIKISIKGETNGTFTLNELTFDKGKIDTTFLLDQYSDSLNVKYLPINATSGQLQIDYLF